MNWRELLLGYPYFKHKSLIKKSKEWSYEQIKEFNQKNIDHSLPISSKKQYMENPERFNTSRFKFLTQQVTTGGTTGTPFRFQRDLFHSRQKERAYVFDIWSEIGYKPFDLRVVYRGNTNSEKMISYNFLENAYNINPKYIIEESKPELIKFLQSLKPFFLHVYPSSLMSVINFLGEEIFGSLNILGIFAGSEALPKSQMDYIRNKFDIPFAHWYGHTEYAVLAKYCYEADVFCFYPTYEAVEFSKNNNTEFYSIVATSYNKIGTRFQRFNTEDVCSGIDEIHCHNNKFISVKRIIGRQQEFFYDLEGIKTAFGPYIFGIHGNFWNYFDKIQLVQEQKGRLIVLIENEKGIKTRTILMERFSNRVELDFQKVDSIKKTISGKHQYFIQKLME